MDAFENLPFEKAKSCGERIQSAKRTNGPAPEPFEINSGCNDTYQKRKNNRRMSKISDVHAEYRRFQSPVKII